MASTDPLASLGDVNDVWPFDTTDAVLSARVDRLIGRASALVRQKHRWVDERIARYLANPADAGGLDPAVAADVVSTIVKRFLANPKGTTNTSVSLNGGSISEGYALRGDTSVRGELEVTAADTAKLTSMQTVRPRMGTIKVGSTIAPLGYSGSAAGIDQMIADGSMFDPTQVSPFAGEATVEQ